MSQSTAQIMRHFILITAALPIVTASMTVANWARPDVAQPSYRNDVQVVHSNGPPTGNGPPTDNGPFVDNESVDAAQASSRRLDQDCQSTAQRWKNQLDATFSVITKAPFVVLGDLPVAELERHLKNIVVPTSSAIRGTYSEHAIDQPVVLMLFGTEASYRRHTQQLFAQRNASVYGYYKPSSRTVAINLESGLGTLVHELTHAIFDFDFHDMPLWLNEGIASLHEQSTFAHAGDGPRIVGEINWRYPILRNAVAANRLRPIQELVTDNEGFRGSREGLNYAHARYLCMYLQQKKRLVPLYKALRDRESNTTDAEALKRLFPGQGWTEINDDFRRWSIALKE